MAVYLECFFISSLLPTISADSAESSGILSYLIDYKVMAVQHIFDCDSICRHISYISETIVSKTYLETYFMSHVCLFSCCLLLPVLFFKKFISRIDIYT